MTDQVKPNGRCPHCNNRFLRKSGESIQLRAHGPVEFTGTACRTKCHFCKAAVQMPVEFQLGRTVPGEKFVLPQRGETK